mgnify:CR=1 FL=1
MIMLTTSPFIKDSMSSFTYFTFILNIIFPSYYSFTNIVIKDIT